MALHEPVEVGLLPRRTLLEHLVELGHHVLHGRHVLGRHGPHLARHLVDGLLHQLLAQLVDQLVEALLGLVGGEVVALQPLDLAGQVGRQHVELQVLAGDRLLGQLLATLVVRRLGGVQALVQLVALLLDQLAQLFGDVLVHAAQVVAVERLLAALRIFSSISRMPSMRSPLRSSKPCCIIRRIAEFRSP